MEIAKKIISASEKYADLTALRALFNMIPYAGGAIDVLITGKASKIQQERIETSIKELAKKLELVEAKSVDNEYLNSDDFFDDMFAYFDKSSRTKSKEKVDLFSDLITKRIQGKKCIIDIKSFLDSLSSLSDDEIFILNIIHETIEEKRKNSEDDRRQIFQINEEILTQHLLSIGINSIDCEFALIRIEKSGFIKEETGNISGYVGGDYYMTNAFQALIEYIN